MTPSNYIIVGIGVSLYQII